MKWQMTPVVQASNASPTKHEEFQETGNACPPQGPLSYLWPAKGTFIG